MAGSVSGKVGSHEQVDLQFTGFILNAGVPTAQLPFGGARFSFWQSWLTQASRFANSQVSAINAGVPSVPYSPESNYSYLTLI